MLGLIGIYGPDAHPVEAARRGLSSLLHRGSGPSAIAVSRGGSVEPLESVLLFPRLLLPSGADTVGVDAAIGATSHTPAHAEISHPQPCFYKGGSRAVAVGLAGGISNKQDITSDLTDRGIVLLSDADGEIASSVIAESPGSLQEAAVTALRQMDGPYAGVALSDRSLLAFRDPRGFWPLGVGQLDLGWVVASESCVLELLGAKSIRDIRAGELLVVDEQGVSSYEVHKPHARPRPCVLEYCCVARPDSEMGGLGIHSVRVRLGNRLADEAPVEADMVTPVPGFARAAAAGFAERSGIPFFEALIEQNDAAGGAIPREHEIAPSGTAATFNAVHDVADERVVVVDDILVRGHRISGAIRALFAAGAREVHVRIASSPVVEQCYYGDGIARPSDLMARSRSVYDVCKEIGSTSLAYLSLDGIEYALHPEVSRYCFACLGGDRIQTLERELPMPTERPTGGYDQLVIFVNEDRSVSVIPVNVGPGEFLRYSDQSLQGLMVSGAITRPDDRMTDRVAKDFEELLNRRGLREREIQEYLAIHPELLLGHEYESALPQVVLPVGQGESLRPDFILRPIAGVSWDARIVELKLPSQRLLRPRPRHRRGMYAGVADAIIQLRTYQRYFEEEAHRTEFAKAMGFPIHRPRLALVVGRTGSFPPQPELAATLQHLHPIELLSYDDLILRYRAMVAAQKQQ